MFLDNLIAFGKKHSKTISSILSLGVGGSAIYMGSVETAMALKVLLIGGGVVLCGVGAILFVCHLCERETGHAEFTLPDSQNSRPFKPPQLYTPIKEENEVTNEADRAHGRYLDIRSSFDEVMEIFTKIFRGENWRKFYQGVTVPEEIIEFRSKHEKICKKHEEVSEKSSSNYYDKIYPLKSDSPEEYIEQVNKANRGLEGKLSEFCKEAVAWKREANSLLKKYSEEYKRYKYTLTLPKGWKEKIEKIPQENNENNKVGHSGHYQCH